MSKKEQLALNAQVESIMGEVYECSRICTENNWKRLRSCTACVTRLNCFYVLKSYNTVIAIIDTRTDTCYDFLRKVYGYTSTSAQHIAKFRQDYGAGKWGCEHSITWREV